MIKVRLVAFALVLAVALSLLSVFIQRTGPARVQYGNLCGPNASDPCYQPELRGGFPFAYLSDAPGVSVERQLSFFEDKLQPAALAIDIGVYFACLLIGACLRSRLIARSRGPAPAVAEPNR